MVLGELSNCILKQNCGAMWGNKITFSNESGSKVTNVNDLFKVISVGSTCYLVVSAPFDLITSSVNVKSSDYSFTLPFFHYVGKEDPDHRQSFFKIGCDDLSLDAGDYSELRVLSHTDHIFSAQMSPFVDMVPRYVLVPAALPVDHSVRVLKESSIDEGEMSTLAYDHIGFAGKDISHSAVSVFESASYRFSGREEWLNSVDFVRLATPVIRLHLETFDTPVESVFSFSEATAILMESGKACPYHAAIEAIRVLDRERIHYVEQGRPMAVSYAENFLTSLIVTWRGIFVRTPVDAQCACVLIDDNKRAWSQAGLAIRTPADSKKPKVEATPEPEPEMDECYGCGELMEGGADRYCGPCWQSKCGCGDDQDAGRDNYDEYQFSDNND